MTFARPELLWLLVTAPIAAVLAGLLWRRRLRDTARWSGRELWGRLLPGYRRGRLVLRVVLLGLAVAGLAGALAGPRWGLTEREVRHRGRDLVLVIDSSLSMSARDVQPDRLAVAKALTARLVQQLPGDRFALVQTEGEGQVMAPLTLDRGVIDLLLDSLAPASLPTPGTRLAQGLEKALELLPEETADHGSILLLTDGEDHGEDHGEIARELRRRRVTVHAVAIGTREGGPIPLAGTGGYKRDRAGTVVVSRLEPDWLRQIAGETGGVYLEARGGGQSLDPLVDALRGGPTHATGTEIVQEETERFPWLLGLSLAAVLGLLLVPPFAPAESTP